MVLMSFGKLAFVITPAARLSHHSYQSSLAYMCPCYFTFASRIASDCEIVKRFDYAHLWGVRIPKRSSGLDKKVWRAFLRERCGRKPFYLWSPVTCNLLIFVVLVDPSVGSPLG